MRKEAGFPFFFLCILLTVLLIIDNSIPISFYFLWCRFEQYVDYALDVPMYFVYRKKKYIDCTGMSFRVSI